HMKKKILLISLALLLAMSLVVIGCPAPENGVEPPPENGVEPPPGTLILKIGATFPMSSPYGYNTEKGYRILVKLFNDAGGFVVQGQRYMLEYISYDDQYTAEGGRAGVERLIYVDGVRHIVGMVGSAPVLGAIPVTEAEKIILMADCTTTTFLEPPLVDSIISAA
ncbi:unnamed protein product, partial [marine sediment metagenome]